MACDLHNKTHKTILNNLINVYHKYFTIKAIKYLNVRSTDVLNAIGKRNIDFSNLKNTKKSLHWVAFLCSDETHPPI